MSKPSVIENLKALSQEYQFGDLVFENALREQLEILKQHQTEYRQALKQQLYNAGEIVSPQELSEIQTRHSLSPAIIGKIYQEEFDLFNTQISLFADNVAQQLRQYGQCDLRQLKRDRPELYANGFKFGKSILQTLVNQEQETFAQAQQQYQETASQQLHQEGQFNDPELDQWQFSSVVTQPLLQQVKQKFVDHQHILEQAYADALHRETVPFSDATCSDLKQKAEELGFSPEVAKQIQTEFLKKGTYQAAVADRVRDYQYVQVISPNFHLSPTDRANLTPLAQDLELADCQELEQEAIATYQTALREYTEAYQTELEQSGAVELTDLQRDRLTTLQQEHKIPGHIVEHIHATLNREYLQRLKQDQIITYSNALEAALKENYPISGAAREFLNSLLLAQALLSPDDITAIEQKVADRFIPPDPKPTLGQHLTRYAVATQTLIVASTTQLKEKVSHTPRPTTPSLPSISVPTISVNPRLLKIGAIASLGVAGVVGAIALKDLITIPEPSSPHDATDSSDPLTPQAEFPASSNLSSVQTSFIPTLSESWNRFLEAFLNTRVASVNEAAEKTDMARVDVLEQMIDEVNDTIPSNAPIYDQVQQYISQWSAALEQASQSLRHLALTAHDEAGETTNVEGAIAKIEEAIELLAAIPETASNYSEAQTAINIWNEQKILLSAIQNTLNQTDINTGILSSQLEELENTSLNNTSLYRALRQRLSSMISPPPSTIHRTSPPSAIRRPPPPPTIRRPPPPGDEEYVPGG